MLNLSQLNWRPEGEDANDIKCSKNTLTYLYKHLVDIDGILGTGFHEDGMDGVSIVLGILLWHFPVNTRGTSNLLCCNTQTDSQISRMNWWLSNALLQLLYGKCPNIVDLITKSISEMFQFCWRYKMYDNICNYSLNMTEYLIRQKEVRVWSL